MVNTPPYQVPVQPGSAAWVAPVAWLNVVVRDRDYLPGFPVSGDMLALHRSRTAAKRL